MSKTGEQIYNLIANLKAGVKELADSIDILKEEHGSPIAIGIIAKELNVRKEELRVFSSTWFKEDES